MAPGGRKMKMKSVRSVGEDVVDEQPTQAVRSVRSASKSPAKRPPPPPTTMKLRSPGVRRPPTKMSPSLKKKKKKKAKCLPPPPDPPASPSSSSPSSSPSSPDQSPIRPEPPRLSSTVVPPQPQLPPKAAVDGCSSSVSRPALSISPAAPSIHQRPTTNGPAAASISHTGQRPLLPAIQRPSVSSGKQVSSTIPLVQGPTPPPIQRRQSPAPSAVQQPPSPSIQQPTDTHFLNQYATFDVRIPVPLNPKSIRSKPVPQGGKQRRGVVNGLRLQLKTRTINKIHVEVGPDGKNPKDPAVRSMLVHEIGSCVRDNVPMIATRYSKLPADMWEIVPRHLSTNFELPPEDEWLWNFILRIAKSRYKDWKSKCKKHFDEHGEELPFEFVYRPEQWEWLVNHFKDPLQQKKCDRMKGIRLDCPRINHHSGKLPLHHRAELLSRNGHKMPYVAAFEMVYGGDPKGAELLKEVKETVDKLLEEQGLHDLELVEEPPLSMDKQIEIVEDVISKHKGKKQPLPRGGRRQNVQSYLDMQEELRRTKEEAAARESAAAAKLTAVEERLQALEDLWRKANQSAMSDGASFYPK